MRRPALLLAGTLLLAACGGSPAEEEAGSPAPAADAQDATEAPDAESGPPETADDAGEPTTELRVVGTDDLAFDPAAFTIPAGAEVTLRFTAEPGVEHDFNIAGAADLGTSSDQRDGHHADDDHHTDDGHHTDEGHGAMHGGQDDLHIAHPDAGQEATETFTIDQAGTYEVYCSIPGHRQAGMVATLHVVDAA